MTSFGLKILGIITMFIDHVGLMFYPSLDFLRIIGRIAFPVFSFQLATGYSHTKSKEKYIFRMLIFAIISQIPFHLFLHTPYPSLQNSLNIGFTLTFSLLGMYILDNVKKQPYKIALIYVLLCTVPFLSVDYGTLGVLLGILFYIFRNSKSFACVILTLIAITNCIIDSSIFSIPMILAVLPILLYNGKKGKNAKYLFYAFYPLHMLLLTLIYKLIM